MNRTLTLISLCYLFVIEANVLLHGEEQPSTAETEKAKLTVKDLGTVPLRYPGVRWTVLCGSYEGVEQFAVNELQRMVQRHFPYVLEVLPVGENVKAGHNSILVGTAKGNPRIAELGQKGLLELPTKAEGYTIACLKSPWDADRRIIAIAGSDPSGVLYGVEELNKRLAAIFMQDLQPGELRAHFDGMPGFAVTEAPVIENRGLWTWGYPIYNYHRYIDNMARLKMNRLTVWNDVPPVNCRQFIEYAHSRGIKVILGYTWGWGYAFDKFDPNNPEHRRVVKEMVLKNYEDRYKDLGMDGIYFQMFTEHSNTALDGKSTAALACDWVNDFARAMLEKHPNLRLEWGLHAISIKDHYGDLKELDPRVTIVWEDAGGMPFSYDPEVPASDLEAALKGKSSDATLEYSQKLAAIRPGAEFAMCAKGWIQLRWMTETEPHGSFILGERAHEYIANRLKERQPRWDYVNAKWAANFPVAQRYYREMRAASKTPMTVVGLVEDGMFEEQIQPSVALLGEMLWNPNREPKEVLEASLSSYYRIVD